VREAFGEGQDEDRGGTLVDHVLQREEERVRRAEGGHGGGLVRDGASEARVDGRRRSSNEIGGGGGRWRRRRRRRVGVHASTLRARSGVEGFGDSVYDEPGLAGEYWARSYYIFC